MTVRLQKFLAEAGVASRRSGERLILDGHVAVNGEVIRELGVKVDAGRDRIFVDGKEVRVRKKLYILLNKPVGFLSSRTDPHARNTVLDLVPKEWGNLYPVGRLDYDSEGLLMLTNDGELCQRLTHPRYGVPKVYEAFVEGKVEASHLAAIKKGVYHNDELLRASSARIIQANNSHGHVELILTEGKNREVRRLFETQGLEVERLVRTRIGPLRLGELPTGKWRSLQPAELKSLRRLVGLEAELPAPAPTSPRSPRTRSPGGKPGRAQRGGLAG